MNKSPSVLIVAAIAAAIIGLTYAVNRPGSPISGADPAEAAIGREDLARLMQAQTEILARLDRLESGRAASRAQMPGRATGSGQRGVPGNADFSPAAAAARQAATIRDRENEFVNEPLASAWAASSERAIKNALSAAALAKEGATAPKSLESTCHSQTCRISMTFNDEMKADFTKVVFLEQIAETLPRAEIFQQPQPDGSIRYLVYARSAGPAVASRLNAN